MRPGRVLAMTMCKRGVMRFLPVDRCAQRRAYVVRFSTVSALGAPDARTHATSVRPRVSCWRGACTGDLSLRFRRVHMARLSRVIGAAAAGHRRNEALHVARESIATP